MSGTHVPETGDFIWLAFDPQAGRERMEARSDPSGMLAAWAYGFRASTSPGVSPAIIGRAQRALATTKSAVCLKVFILVLQVLDL